MASGAKFGAPEAKFGPFGAKFGALGSMFKALGAKVRALGAKVRAIFGAFGFWIPGLRLHEPNLWLHLNFSESSFRL